MLQTLYTISLAAPISEQADEFHFSIRTNQKRKQVEKKTPPREMLSCTLANTLNIEEEQSILADLVKKMDDLLKETEFSAYDPCYMKRKLEEFYGEDIISGGSGFGICFCRFTA